MRRVPSGAQSNSNGITVGSSKTVHVREPSADIAPIRVYPRVHAGGSSQANSENASVELSGDQRSCPTLDRTVTFRLDPMSTIDRVPTSFGPDAYLSYASSL